MIYYSGREPLYIPDTSVHPLTQSLSDTKEANIGCYLGVPIILNNGEMYGTLCAVDPMPYKVNEQDIERLKICASFIANSIDLSSAFKIIQRDREIMTSELELAKKVQANVLHHSDKSTCIEINAIFEPSEYLSGDLYYWHQFNEQKFGVVVMDVMGHGVASALVSMSVRSLLQELINNDPDPAHVFQKLNSYLVSHFASEETLNTYLTAFYMIIDLEAETIQYVNAGHPAPLIFMGDHVIALDQGTIPVGMFEEISIETSTIPIGSSGKMIIYTDGILEIFDECNKSYTNTLEALYRRCEGDFTIYRNEILHDIKSHEQIKDDICMLFIEFNL